MIFWEAELHPAATLIAWLLALFSLQFFGYFGIGLLGLFILISAPASIRAFLVFIWRARWLLLMLWIILAYNTPGEAFHDFAWAPTYEGLAEANLHAFRLLMILACLAWLFNRLGRDGLLSALWGLLLPFRFFGLDVERLLVRLSLVLERLQLPAEKGAWRRLLIAQPDFTQGPKVLHFSQPAWHLIDGVVVIFVSALFIGVLAL